MKKSKLTVALALVVTVSAWLFAVRANGAETPAGFSRKVLQDQELAVPGRHAVVALIEFAAGAAAGRHTHPGEELGYVMEGSVVLEVDGKAPQTFKAGESFFIPAGVIHTAKNAGNTPAKVISSYFLEAGKPLATPAK